MLTVMHAPLMSRRRFAGAGALMALAPALLPGQARATPERPRVAVAVSAGNDLAHLPLVVAEQLGYFRAGGLEVELLDNGSPTDIGCDSFEQVLQMQGRGQDQQAFVQLGRAPGLALGVSSRSLPQFRQLADLRGRRIGVSGGGAHLMAQLVLLRAGVAPADWQLVLLGGPTAALLALRGGQVDALCAGEPAMTLAEQRGEVRITSDARTLKGAAAVFGGPMPAACLHASQEFVLRHPGVCQALAVGVVRALRWLQTAGPRDLTRTVPESHLLGDLGLYLGAFERMREAYSVDGLMTADAARTSLRALAAFDPGLHPERIELGRSYTNAFALKVGERGRA